MRTAKPHFQEMSLRSSFLSKIKNIYDAADTTAPAASANINCKACGKPLVKPDTVLFGTNLPQLFFRSVEADFPENADLLLILGTSLAVSPANQLVHMVC